jgi:hypothetical protein
MPQPKNAQEKQVDEMLAKPKGAAAKLAYIQTHLSNVEKTGRNEHHKYNYMQEHGLIDLLRPFLRAMNCSVVLSPANDVQRTDNRVVVIGSLTFTDADANPYVTAEDGRSFVFDANGMPILNLDRSITANFAGEGIDPQDKATNKAHTGFAKYALQKFFLVPTEHVDDSDSEEVTEASRFVKNQGTPVAPEVLEHVLAQVKDGIAAGTLDRNKVQAKLTTLKVKRAGDLDDKGMNVFSKWVDAQLNPEQVPS